MKSTTGPWHCELCEELSSQGSGSLATNSLEKPYFVAECGLCGGTASAFRKSVDGQWIHALCAEVNTFLSVLLIMFFGMVIFQFLSELMHSQFNFNVVGVRVKIQTWTSESYRGNSEYFS